MVHDSPWEKVLGYLYNPTTDKMRLILGHSHIGVQASQDWKSSPPTPLFALIMMVKFFLKTDKPPDRMSILCSLESGDL